MYKMRPVERVSKQCEHTCVVGQVTRKESGCHLIDYLIKDYSVVTLYEGDSITLFNFCPCCGQELNLFYTVENNKYCIIKET